PRRGHLAPPLGKARDAKTGRPCTRSVHVPEQAGSRLGAIGPATPGACRHDLAARADLFGDRGLDAETETVGRRARDPAATARSVDDRFIREVAADLAEEQGVDPDDAAAVPKQVALELDTGKNRIGDCEVGARNRAHRADGARSREGADTGRGTGIEAFE